MLSFLSRKDRLLILVGSLGVAILSAWGLVNSIKTTYLPLLSTFNFIDVGQGDATLIESRAGHRILIDGGPDARASNYLLKKYPSTDLVLDAVILTHPDNDHLGGLRDVLNHFRARAVFITGVIQASNSYNSFLLQLEQTKTPVYVITAGSQLIFGEISLKIISPHQSWYGAYLTKSNNTGIVIDAKVGARHFLLTGDIESGIEKALVKNGLSQNFDVIKVPHHGSKTSSSPELLNDILAPIAVIEVGANNTYGHPNQGVLTRYQAGETLRTDLFGTVTVSTDGASIWLECEHSQACQSG